MSKFNKTYRIRTEVGNNTNIHVNLDRDYDILEIMSLKINQENAYKLHTSNYGVIAGRVLANEAMGIPNAKVSVFINIDKNDINDVVKSVLYPYNTTLSKDKDGVRYNLLPNEVITDCHTVIGTFPSKQYLLDNDDILEIFEKYYKYTTRTNNAGDFMIFGVPTGTQTVHVDIDLSDIGILSQKPRDMVYKGYNIEQFENPNKFKYDTNIDSLAQVISQDAVIDVIPFWGDKNETSTIGISRCDVNIQYKFEPTCVFIGSIVSDSKSNGIGKKCIPTPGTGSMEDITTGSGTIEMIRKTPFGDVEEFQIKGTQLIDGNGVWCYQIPMNLDYMMTDEYGNMVPTDNPNKGVPTRTRVRFRISMQDFENDNSNMFRCKMLVPHNPDIYSDSCDNELDYSFGTKTKDISYRDLFWNGVYSVKSFIPRIQKGTNWKNEKFTGIKRINYHGDKNPIPYNNIRIKIPFMYTIMCVIIKGILKMVSLLNWVFLICARAFVKQDDDNSGGFISLSGDLCSDNLETLCIIPGIDVNKVRRSSNQNKTTLLGMALLKHYSELGGDLSDMTSLKDGTQSTNDTKSIDYNNSNNDGVRAGENTVSGVITDGDGKEKRNARVNVSIKGVRVTDKLDYLIQCIEMNLAHEYKVIQFDFYNDWINGMIYIPRWMRTITKKRSFLWGAIKFGGKVKACNEEFKSGNRNIVQQCGLDYNFSSSDNTVSYNVVNNIGCKSNANKLRCHKSNDVRKKYSIFKNNGIVKSFQIESTKQYVYYFKPYENSGKNVRLFATDIILLGTLNSCDKFGIENNLTELVSSTYQMPPNLALTDSDIEGNDYQSNNSNDRITMTVKENKGKIVDIVLNGCYVGVNPMDEYGNYTELSGIDWAYSGPLQTSNGGDISKFFKPGGHFLGISCRNSETTVKTCVNLSRICEHGVWMSQRHELLIPKSETPSSQSDAFLKYATVPSGLISKDEISGTDYRRMFASMNKNRLKTKNENGILEYDFVYVNPTNFSGDLNIKVSGENTKYNRYITNRVEEKEIDYTDDDYFTSKINKRKYEPETQIMRTGEYSDKEYLKYRFGFTDETINNSGERNKRFLISSGSNVSFPMYDNSFYFYFGLYDGKTALDEFKKMYYSVCEKNNDLNIIDNGIDLSGLTTTYDGVCDTIGTGTIEFTLKTVQSFFDGKNSLTIKLRNSSGNVVSTVYDIMENNKKITFNKLKTDTYSIEVSSSNDMLNDIFYADVKQVSVNANIIANPFIKTFSETDGKDIFSKYHGSRDELGGYIIIDDNVINYEDNNNIQGINIFNGGVVSRIEISYLIETKDGEGNINYIESNIITGNLSNGEIKTLNYSNTDGTAVINPIETVDNKYIIPVPYGDTTYVVYASTIMENCKVNVNANGNVTNGTIVHKWRLGEVYVKKAIPISVFYGNVDIELLKQYFNINDNVTTVNGWWTRFQDEDESIKWNLKKLLYASKLPHKITINVGGGAKPTAHKLISGMTETIDETTKEIIGLNSDVSSLDSGNVISVLSNVNIPTLNWVDPNRRYHFAYRAVDTNGQQYPDEPFIIPVIYKPFFTELCLFNISHLNRYILYGYTYNGLTWVGQGFNDVRLNNEPIFSFIPINELKGDETMELNEIISGNTIYSTSGLSYTGEYCKYNGRKSKVNKELEELKYSLTSGVLKLYIGNLHTEINEDDGTEIASYSNSTEINVSGVTFDKFIKTEKITRVEKELKVNRIYIKPISTTEDGVHINVEYKAYSYFDVNSKIEVTANTEDGLTISGLSIEKGTRESTNSITLRHYKYWGHDIILKTMTLNISEDETQVYGTILYTSGTNEDGYKEGEEYIPDTVSRPETKCLIKIEHEKNNELYDVKQITNYDYPVNGENININDRLFKGVIEDSISVADINDNDGFIDINNISDRDRKTITKLYYISTPKNLSVTKKSIDDNCLKTVNISEMIDLSKYYKFYPLDLQITGVDKKIGSGYDSYYETEITIRSKYDEKSRNNFKNKKYTLTFYNTINNIEKETETFEFETNTDEIYIIKVTGNKRTNMGINFTNDNEVKNLRYEYTVSEIDGSISRTYGNTIIDGNEIKYYAIIKHLT